MTIRSQLCRRGLLPLAAVQVAASMVGCDSSPPPKVEEPRAQILCGSAEIPALNDLRRLPDQNWATADGSLLYGEGNVHSILLQRPDSLPMRTKFGALRLLTVTDRQQMFTATWVQSDIYLAVSGREPTYAQLRESGLPAMAGRTAFIDSTSSWIVRNSLDPWPSPNLATEVAIYAEGSCERAEHLHIRYGHGASGSYTAPNWSFALLDLTGPALKVVGVPLAANLNEDPLTMFTVTGVSPWTVRKAWVDSKGNDQVEGLFEYRTGGFVHRDAPLWVKDLVAAGTLDKAVTDPRFLAIVDSALVPLVPQGGPNVRGLLRRTLSAQENRSWSLIDGRIIVMRVETFYEGNHPVLAATDAVAVDPISRQAWLIQQEWHMDDWPERMPKSVVVYGSAATVPASTYTALLGTQFIPSAQFGTVVISEPTVSLVGLPWRCTGTPPEDGSGPRESYYLVACSAGA